jgi:hypothetical protein
VDIKMNEIKEGFEAQLSQTVGQQIGQVQKKVCELFLSDPSRM